MGDCHWSSNHRPNSTSNDLAELQPRESAAILYATVTVVGGGFLFYFLFEITVDAMKVNFNPQMITPVFALLIGHYLNNEDSSLTLWFERNHYLWAGFI